MVNRIHKWTIVSGPTLVAHALFALVLAAAMYWLPNMPPPTDRDTLLRIFTSLIPATGALLGITAALATFFSRFAADAREKGLDRLGQSRARLERQMKESAGVDSSISNRLVSLYQMAAWYVPGQMFKTGDIERAHSEFYDWAKKQVSESSQQGRQFSYGDTGTYDSREKHLFDASLRSLEVMQDLVFLECAGKMARAVPSLWFLVLGWLLAFGVVLGATFFAGLGIIPVGWSSPILVGSFYLVAAALAALAFNARAIIFLTVLQEIGYDKSEPSPSNQAT